MFARPGPALVRRLPPSLIRTSRRSASMGAALRTSVPSKPWRNGLVLVCATSLLVISLCALLWIDWLNPTESSVLAKRMTAAILGSQYRHVHPETYEYVIRYVL